MTRAGSASVADRASADLERGRAHSALRRLDRAAHAGRDNARLRYLRVTALLELGRAAAAYPIAADLAAAHPRNARIQLKWAAAASARGDAAAAATALRRALTIDPERRGARWRLGHALLQTGNWDEAAAVLEPIVDDVHGCWLAGRLELVGGPTVAGYGGPSRSELEQMDGAEAVVVTTEPKAGTNWIRFLIGNYLRLLAGGGGGEPPTAAELTEEGFLANQRWWCCCGIEPVRVPHPMIGELGFSDMTVQHFSVSEDVLAGCRARRVIAQRHPLDLLVSRFHYFYRDREDAARLDDLGTVEDIADVAERELIAIARLRHRSEAAATDPLTADVVAYEDLEASAPQRVATVLAAIGLPIDSPLLERAVAFSDRRVVRRQEQESGPLHPHLSTFFTRDGSVGQWRTALSERQQRWAKELLADLGVSLED